MIHNNKNGNIALMLALFLPIFIGFIGLTVDLGILYTAKFQLQNAADSAALAGTNELAIDSNGDNIAEANYDGARNTAISLTESNEMLNHKLLWSGNDIFEAGKWDNQIEDFASVGYTSDPKGLDGSSVFLTRAVKTFFIKIFGIHEVQINAKSISFVGCAGNGTRADLPIAINKAKLTTPLEIIVFNSENEENGQYTSFDIWPCNTSTIMPFIYGAAHGGIDPPPMDLGADIYLSMNNGVVATLFDDFQIRYDMEKDINGEYPVRLPVVEWTQPQNRGKLVGFVYFVITDVQGPGGKKTESKHFVGYMSNGLMLADGASGGECYGVRASQAMLVKN